MVFCLFFFFLRHIQLPPSLPLPLAPSLTLHADHIALNKPKASKHEAHILSWCLCACGFKHGSVFRIFMLILFSLYLHAHCFSVGRSVDSIFLFHTRSVSQRQHLPYLLEMWFGIFYSHSFLFASFLMHAMVVSDAIAGKRQKKISTQIAVKFFLHPYFFFRQIFMRRIINKWLMTANDDGCYTVCGPRLLQSYVTGIGLCE